MKTDSFAHAIEKLVCWFKGHRFGPWGDGPGRWRCYCCSKWRTQEEDTLEY